jgi:hypothetical protein
MRKIAIVVVTSILLFNCDGEDEAKQAPSVANQNESSLEPADDKDSADSELFIRNGTIDTRGLYSSVPVLLRVSRDMRILQFCSGSLVGPRLDRILSAADCTYDSAGNHYGGTSDYRVGFLISGSNQLRLFSVSNLAIAPGYQHNASNSYTNDLAVFSLSQGVPSSIASPRRVSFEAPSYNATATLNIVGFGSNGVNLDSTFIRRYGTSNIVRVEMDGSLTMSPGSANQVICPGDSGGPVIDSRGDVVAVNSAVNYDGSAAPNPNDTTQVCRATHTSVHSSWNANLDETNKRWLARLIGYSVPSIVAPSGLRVINNSGKWQVIWLDNSSNESFFRIERKVGSTFIEVARVSANSTSFIDTNAPSTRSYSYRVRASNGEFSSSYSNEVATTGTTFVLEAPSNFRLSMIPQTRDANSSWEYSGTNAVSFEILRGLMGPHAPGVEGVVLVRSVPATVRSLKILDALGGSFSLRAVAADGTRSTKVFPNTVVSPPVSIPLAPSGLRVVRDSRGVTFRWTDNSNNETSFVIAMAATCPCLPGQPTHYESVRISANRTVYTVPDMADGFYSIRAENSAGASGYSNSVQLHH